MQLRQVVPEDRAALGPRFDLAVFAQRQVQRGAAVVVSSHLLGQIESLCTKFLILRLGKRIAYGSKESIRADLATLGEGASLEEIFFEATEGSHEGRAR